ncbi:F0F1 ATP synthase subunit B [Megalodesulfovibrio gigas]|uniref:ATP synthase subunit b n=1 Tax=Megalodesulfovibrio gigas (strain ATCC 19364 / DSM 1382 / NCIMB 9332 / VKM B-1759) TaxID=1121448 RepID=T2G7L7_MEGG1|nr:F0F1 ATP synthase subunit B [Megalodesulfovibrio gigas]AGW12560.1 putative H+transporting two-sector ATPase subunit B/B' [Megalodesulfovibrio gigas DSM 1382 = ATCC 19364]
MNTIWKLLSATALVCLAAVPALASDGGAGPSHDWMNFLFRIINFVLFVGIIYYLAGKKIADFFKTRRYTIENDLADLSQRKVDAEKRLKDVEASIANIDAERKAILDDYRTQGEALKVAIIEKANKTAEQITAQAAMTAEQESRLAVERIRGEMADMVIEAAEKLLKDKLNAQEQEKLIDKYLTKVVLN